MCYSGRGLRDFLKRHGFSSQKPIKPAYQRDPQKVEAWLNQTYPAIKVRAMQEGARISGQMKWGVNRGRTYGLVNKTPFIKLNRESF